MADSAQRAALVVPRRRALVVGGGGVLFLGGQAGATEYYSRETLPLINCRRQQQEHRRVMIGEVKAALKSAEVHNASNLSRPCPSWSEL